MGSGKKKIRIGDTTLSITVLNADNNLKENLNSLLSEACDRTKPARGVVGFDVVKDSNIRRRINRLVLSTATQCLIVTFSDSVASPQFPRSLATFLQSPDISFVGVGMGWCTAAMEKGYGVSCRNAVDLGWLAADVWGDPGVKWCDLVGLADRACGVSFDAYSTIESFDSLDSNAVHAYVCFLVGSRLLGGGERVGGFGSRNRPVIEDLGD